VVEKPRALLLHTDEYHIAFEGGDCKLRLRCANEPAYER
jgi:hypothetical protein